MWMDNIQILFTSSRTSSRQQCHFVYVWKCKWSWNEKHMLHKYRVQHIVMTKSFYNWAWIYSKILFHRQEITLRIFWMYSLSAPMRLRSHRVCFRNYAWENRMSVSLCRSMLLPLLLFQRNKTTYNW